MQSLQTVKQHNSLWNYIVYDVKNNKDMYSFAINAIGILGSVLLQQNINWNKTWNFASYKDVSLDMLIASNFISLIFFMGRGAKNLYNMMNKNEENTYKKYLQKKENMEKFKILIDRLDSLNAKDIVSLDKFLKFYSMKEVEKLVNDRTQI